MVSAYMITRPDIMQISAGFLFTCFTWKFKCEIESKQLFLRNDQCDKISIKLLPMLVARQLFTHDRLWMWWFFYLFSVPLLIWFQRRPSKQLWMSIRTLKKHLMAVRVLFFKCFITI